MKRSIVPIVMTCILSCSILSCNFDNLFKLKMEDAIYNRVEAKIDSFANDYVSTFSLSRVKKVEERINQIGLRDEVVLDTLPDNTLLVFNKINGLSKLYLKDNVSVIEVYSTNRNISDNSRSAIFESYEGMKRKLCEHWRKVCSDPELTFTHEQKLECKLYLTFYCN